MRAQKLHKLETGTAGWYAGGAAEWLLTENQFSPSQLFPADVLRETTQRAAILTMRVIKNSANPVAIRALMPSSFVSGNFAAIFEEMVLCLPAWRCINDEVNTWVWFYMSVLVCTKV